MHALGSTSLVCKIVFFCVQPLSETLWPRTPSGPGNSVIHDRERLANHVYRAANEQLAAALRAKDIDSLIKAIDVPAEKVGCHAHQILCWRRTCQRYAAEHW